MNLSARFYVLAGLLFLVMMTFSGYAITNQANQESAHSASKNQRPHVSGLTAGRAKSIAGGLLALASLVAGGVAKARRKRGLAKFGLATGLIALLLSVLHLSSSASAAYGSGSGKAGALVALALGLIGTTLSAVALRKTTGS